MIQGVKFIKIDVHRYFYGNLASATIEDTLTAKNYTVNYVNIHNGCAQNTLFSTSCTGLNNNLFFR